MALSIIDNPFADHIICEARNYLIEEGRWTREDFYVELIDWDFSPASATEICDELFPRVPEEDSEIDEVEFRCPF